MDIVEANLEHVTGIVRVNDFVQRIHAECHPDIFRYPVDSQELASFFQTKVVADTDIVFVATIDFNVVGYIWASVVEKVGNVFKHPQQLIYIHHVAVDGDFRRAGIGAALMKHVSEIADIKGVTDLRVDYWSFNDAAAAFFNAHGYRPYNVNLWRRGS